MIFPCMSGPRFIYLTISGRSGRFQLLATVNSAAVSKGCKYLFKTCAFISFVAQLSQGSMGRNLEDTL